MSETPQNPAGPTEGVPVMRVLNQYLKDLSFESPGAPLSLRQDLPAPNVEVSVDVNARKIGDDQYEVELSCSAAGKRGEDTAFVVETNYAGLFLIQNLPENQLEPALLVEAPRILFPFARQIVASATRDGGMLPLMLDPLDFGGMYAMQLAERQKAASGEDGPAPVENA